MHAIIVLVFHQQITYSSGPLCKASCYVGKNTDLIDSLFTQQRLKFQANIVFAKLPISQNRYFFGKNTAHLLGRNKCNLNWGLQKMHSLLANRNGIKSNKTKAAAMAIN